MTRERDLPRYVEPSFLRGLTASRITRRDALKGAGALGLGTFLAACGVGGSTAPSRVNWVWDKATKTGQLDFANWPLYIDSTQDASGATTHPSLDQFTKDTGIKVNYSEPIQDDPTFFAKIAPELKLGQATGYDLMVITNGIQMTNLQLKHWLVELDPAKLPNFFQNAAPRLKDRSYDPGNRFTIPWQSGFTGIAYNPSLTGREITSFEDLFDPKFAGKVGMMDGNQDTGNLTLIGMGINPQKSTPKDWQKAADKLKKQRDDGIVRKYYDQTYIKALSAGDTWISMAWSGDIFQANLSAGNDDLKFVIPVEGGVIWTDNMCIPVGAAHPLDAITYMNYVYQPAIAAMLAESIDYVTPVPSAKDAIDKDVAQTTDPAAKQSLQATAGSPLVFPSQSEYAHSYYYRELTPSEAGQWNDIFGAVILT
ncbi:extracellular solute-binding protein [bacterium]|nr:MAG: extracellular solute-binding protein [bacterium]